MNVTRVLGVDPGPTTGIALIWQAPGCKYPGHAFAQCSAVLAEDLVRAIHNGETLIAVERFVVGRKSMRAGISGEITRNLVGALESEYATLVLTNASEAKAWATDRRLEAADLMTATAGMRHARDAARHALYAAHKHAGYPDPLSSKAHRP